jgi:hypothetical protein
MVEIQRRDAAPKAATLIIRYIYLIYAEFENGLFLVPKPPATAFGCASDAKLPANGLKSWNRQR